MGTEIRANAVRKLLMRKDDIARRSLQLRGKAKVWLVENFLNETCDRKCGYCRGGGKFCAKIAAAGCDLLFHILLEG